ncbi:MAG: RNA polymerase sigma factor [Rhodobacteraceae bacterium]|nr:RNA polymerase sigma factor [Paracoccaceae bacterium]
MPFDALTPRNSTQSPASADPKRLPQSSNDGVIPLDELQRGNHATFRVLVAQHRPWMLAVARRYVKDAALAEDCVQDALISAYRHRRSFEGRSSLKSWLHRITINAALMKLRARRRHDDRAIDSLPSALTSDAVEGERAWMQVPPPTPEQQLAQSQIATILRAKIQELPDHHRDILRLRDLEERSNAEAAAMLNITEGAAKVRLHRARAALRRLLAEIISELR